MRRRIRELLGDQLARNPVPRDAPVPLDVRHRAFLRAMPEVVWRLVSSPRPGLDVAAGCVRVLGLPHIGDSASGNEVVALWRRTS